MIEGVKVSLLRQIEDDRGKVMHMLRKDSEVYARFGEIYFSCINTGAVKAWKLHKKMTLNCAVPQGQVKFVLFDARASSKTHGQIQEIHMGPQNYVLLTVPPRIWTGFTNIGGDLAILANCATETHCPDECERKDYMSPFIPYDWGAKKHE
ncbi:MAG: dTDP-4-dehydrorhamnose 3,5-epimerase family protein [Gammaproteobacteria bacterium]|nr:dTDP-4-dehydrorhamnose 3,5-epimerase family protein [Gammaproteobacteria bacterium]